MLKTIYLASQRNSPAQPSLADPVRMMSPLKSSHMKHRVHRLGFGEANGQPHDQIT